MDATVDSVWRDTTEPTEHGVLKATKMLLQLQHYLAASTLLALVMVIVNQYKVDAIAEWIIFTTLFVGQGAVLALIGWVLWIAIKPLLGHDEYDIKDLVELSRRNQRTWSVEDRNRWNGAMKWRVENADLLLLLQKTVLGALWIFLVTACVVYSECLALWARNSWSWVVPLYVIGGLRLFNSVLCRSVPLLEIVSWLLATLFLAFYNVRASYDSSTAEDAQQWTFTDVTIPLYVLLGGWMAVSLSILVEYKIGYVSLRRRQVEALCLYIGAFTLFIIAVATYSADQDSDIDEGSTSTHPGAATTALFATTLAFAGAHISVSEAVHTLLIRRGACRPLPLTRGSSCGDSAGDDDASSVGMDNYDRSGRDSNSYSNSSGGWAVDTATMHRYNVLIGEYDVISAKPYPTAGAASTALVAGGGDTDSCLFTHITAFIVAVDRVLLVLGIDCCGGIVGCCDGNGSGSSSGSDGKDRHTYGARREERCCACCEGAFCCGGGIELVDQLSNGGGSGGGAAEESTPMLGGQ
jgi:hypothetical protein